MSVVLPAPFGPEQPEELALLDSRSTPASACTVPKLRLRFEISTAAVIVRTSVHATRRHVAEVAGGTLGGVTRR